MKIAKNLFLILLMCLAVYVLSYRIGSLFDRLYPGAAGSFIDGSALVGMPLVSIFFTIFLFTAFGDNTKKWWIGITLIPAILFEVAFDMYHIYFPIAVALIAWVLGTAVQKIVKMVTKKS